MKSLLNALHEGRLVELPIREKNKALEYLALLLEAVPDIGGNRDLVADVLKREAAANTGIGSGVACPHVRSATGEELLCAVGWSPEGIEYGSPDGKNVHLVVLYFIPDSQRNFYLKEVSGLAKAIHETEDVESLYRLQDLQSVRNRLLDWIEIAVDKAMPDAKARMIKLEERHAIASAGPAAPESGMSRDAWSVVPFTVVVTEARKCLVLSPNAEWVERLESVADLHRHFGGSVNFELAGCRIAVLSSAVHAKDRAIYECVAVRMAAQGV
jgi:nitrogen PTS system EIIA component